ncbi:MAG TPA: hypothetical protein VI522_03245 [Gammaproteobacteria bacterium]|nr:hypothetical protein [Gammaproteobacteria bacterium]
MLNKLNCAVLATVACLGSSLAMASAEGIAIIQCGASETGGQMNVTAYSASIPEVKAKVGDDCSAALVNVIQSTASTHFADLTTTSSSSRIVYTVRLSPIVTQELKD